MAERAKATVPADLSGFALPERFTNEDRDGFARGVTALREGDFYLAHDLWEEVWHAYSPADRRLLQGFIHVAVGAYHFQCGNRKGCRSQFRKALDKMGPFAPRHWGIDVDSVLSAVRTADPGAEASLDPERLKPLQGVI